MKVKKKVLIDLYEYMIIIKNYLMLILQSNSSKQVASQKGYLFYILYTNNVIFF
jgi:hypothetical protein